MVVLSVVTPVQAPAYLTLARAARAGRLHGGRAVPQRAAAREPRRRRAADAGAAAPGGRGGRPLRRAGGAGRDAHHRPGAGRGPATAPAAQRPALRPGVPFTPAGTARPAIPAGPATPGASATPARAAAAEAPGPHHRLLFFGIVRPYKGLDILLRALAEAGPQVSLTVAGEIWDGQEELLRLISGLGLQDRVTMPGRYVPTAEVPEAFARPTPWSCPTGRPRPHRTRWWRSSSVSRSSRPARARSRTPWRTGSTGSCAPPATPVTWPGRSGRSTSPARWSGCGPGCARPTPGRSGTTILPPWERRSPPGALWPGTAGSGAGAWAPSRPARATSCPIRIRQRPGRRP